MFLKIQNHIIDIDMIRHIQVLPPILVIDISGEEAIQIDFHSASEAQTAFDDLAKLLQAQAISPTKTGMN